MEQKRKSIKETVYNDILNAIIKGEFSGGQILNEQELIEKFGCSKSPVREALVMLCNEKVLTSIPRYGYEVVRLTGDNIIQIMAFRRILECGLLRDSASHIAGKQISELEKINQKYNTFSEDILKNWEINQEFHLKLASFSNNEYACEQLYSSMKILKIAYAQTFWNKWGDPQKEIVNVHVDIINALKNGDTDKAVQALEKDLTALRL